MCERSWLAHPTMDASTHHRRVSSDAGSIGKDKTRTQSPVYRGPLITSGIVLAILLGAHTALIILWSTETLKKHLFPLDRVSEVTQIVTVGTQTTVTVLLIVLSSIVQVVAADQVIRKSTLLLLYSPFTWLDLI